MASRASSWNAASYDHHCPNVYVHYVDPSRYWRYQRSHAHAVISTTTVSITLPRTTYKGLAGKYILFNEFDMVTRPRVSGSLASAMDRTRLPPSILHGVQRQGFR